MRFYPKTRTKIAVTPNLIGRDPPLVVQITKTTSENTQEFLDNLADRLVCVLFLTTPQGLVISCLEPERDDMIINNQALTSIFDGQTCIRGQVLDDNITGSKSIFFAFTDLSVRMGGSYVICCRLLDLYDLKYSRVLSTRPFQVFPPKSFPGMMRMIVCLTFSVNCIDESFV